MQEEIVDAFLLLLRDALWGTRSPLLRPLTSEQWKGLFNLACQQAVDGLLMDVIAELPNEQKPPLPLRLQWIARQQKIEQKNLYLIKELHAVLQLLQERKISVILLKGQGAASRYPYPLHRHPGDIDLLAIDDASEVNKLMLELGADHGIITPEHHIEYMYHGEPWEIHHFILDMNHPSARKYMNSSFPKEPMMITVGGRDCPVLQPSFDAVYMVAHMVVHLFFSGINIRQLCDWVLLLHKEHATIQGDLFQKHLKGLKMERPFKVLGVIAVERLGLPRDEFPLDYSPHEIRISNKIWQNVLQQGLDGGEKTATINNYLRVFKRCIQMYDFCPSETAWRPLMKLVRFIRHKKIAIFGYRGTLLPTEEQ